MLKLMHKKIFTILCSKIVFILTYGDLQRGSYMSAHVVLNLLNELWKRDKMQGLPSIYIFFATSLINSIILEQEC